MKKICILAILLAILACPGKKNEQKGTSFDKDFTLTSIDGVEYTLSELKGQVILIDFWATWCPPCRSSIPVFVRLHEKYSDRGFIVLGISSESASTLQQYRDENNIPYPILIGNKQLMREYGVTAIPSIFILDKKGNTVKKQVGFSPEIEAEFEGLIDSLLNE